MSQLNATINHGVGGGGSTAVCLSGDAVVGRPTANDDQAGSFAEASGYKCSVSVGGPGDAKLFSFKHDNSDKFCNGLKGHHHHNQGEDFEGLDLGDDHQDLDPVPLGEILEKFHAEDPAFTDHSDYDNTALVSEKVEENLIRLHAAVCGGSSNDSNLQELAPADNNGQTISATVNVATLDLSDPESIHQHLSQLNDTVLKVKGFEDKLNIVDPSNLVSSLMSPSSQSSPTGPTFLTPPSVTLPQACSSEGKPPQVSPLGPPTPPNSSTSSPMLSRRAGAGGTHSQACSVCGKTFSNASALAKHRLTHSEERKYHCNICSKAFKRQDHLNGHLLTHRSTKPFACMADGCGKSYCDARSLRRHRENHHNGAGAGSSGSKKASKKKDERDSSPMISFYKPGDTKVKFSSKGLNAQQLQLIEKLLKESKGEATTDDVVAAKALAAVQSPPKGKKVAGVSATSPGTPPTSSSSLPASEAGKPVECTICNRKFKNVPALNGHMRLHGGYYKKDDKKPEAKSKVLTNGLTTITPITKRKLPTTSSSSTSITKVNNNNNGLTVFQAKSSTLSISALQSSVLASTPSSLTIKPALVEAEPPAKKYKSCLAFPNLPPPDTNKLLANLELKTQQQTLYPSQQILQNNNGLRSLRIGKNGLFVDGHPAGLEISPTQLITPSTTSYTTTSPKNQSLLAQFLPSAPLPSNNCNVISSLSRPERPPVAGVVLKVDVDADTTPKIGPEYQADIPHILLQDEVKEDDPELSEIHEELMWSPRAACDLSDDDISQFVSVAGSVAGGASQGEESALKLLLRNGGDLRSSLRQVLETTVEHDTWNEVEVDAFYEAMMRNHKDFERISSEVGSKSVKECVKFYYFWKNLCREEARSFKSICNSPDETGNNYGGSIIMTSASTESSSPVVDLTTATSLFPFSLSITSLSAKR